MRLTTLSGLSISLLLAGFLASVPSAFAATDATDLYVNNQNSSCADTGSGTEAVPFCTIQAAANVVEPGQTVHVISAGEGIDGKVVKVTRSGTATEPITFVADTAEGGPVVYSPGFIVNGAQDVVISGFTVDNLVSTYPDILVTGGSSDVTVSRNTVTRMRFAGIELLQAGTGNTVTTNVVWGGNDNGITVTDSPGATITSNTVGSNCGSGVLVSYHSTGATIENNILTQNTTNTTSAGTCTDPNGSQLGVSADSTSGSSEDYNIVYDNGATQYVWNGVSYDGTLAAYQSATGQGAHDTIADPDLDAGHVPTEGSPAIDSADANAPGELSTDIVGNPRVDDPLVPNTGTGVGYYDRGAYEFQYSTTAG